MNTGSTGVVVVSSQSECGLWQRRSSRRVSLWGELRGRGVGSAGGAVARRDHGMFANHLPWYTERKNDLSSRLNAAESMRAAALLNAQAKGLDSREEQHDASASFSGSGSEVGSEDFDADVEILGVEGDTTVQSIASETSFDPAGAGSSALPPLTDRRCTHQLCLLVPSTLPLTVGEYHN